MFPLALSSMFLITANVRTYFAFICFHSLPLHLSHPTVLSFPLSGSSLFILSLCNSVSPAHSRCPGVSFFLSLSELTSQSTASQHHRITASSDMTCRRRLWGAVGTHGLDSRRQGFSAPTNETPDSGVKHTLCLCVYLWGCARACTTKTRREGERERCRSNEHKNKGEHANERQRRTSHSICAIWGHDREICMFVQNLSEQKFTQAGTIFTTFF